MKKSTRAVVFDCGEVLVNGCYGIHRRIGRALGQKYVLNCRIQEKPELRLFFQGQITEEQLWRSMISYHSWPMPVWKLKALVRQGFTKVPGTLEIVDTLRRHGVRLGLLSVHGREWVEHIDAKFQHHSLFRYLSYSYDEGICKPHPESFLGIARKMGTTPEETLVIDDSRTNIRTATKLGFQTHRFTSAPRLKRELVRRGLLLA